jgi:hypothetical protein
VSTRHGLPQVISLDDLTDHGDRFEGIWAASDGGVTVSIDKLEIDGSTEANLKIVHDRLVCLLEASRQYFIANRSRYNVDYIDDLSEPQIILTKDTCSVFWWSDAGEVNGECIIGIDFRMSNLAPLGIVIGD